MWRVDFKRFFQELKEMLEGNQKYKTEGYGLQVSWKWILMIEFFFLFWSLCIRGDLANFIILFRMPKKVLYLKAFLQFYICNLRDLNMIYKVIQLLRFYVLKYKYLIRIFFSYKALILDWWSLWISNGNWFRRIFIGKCR